jgi:malonyl-CoA/methylmalonyl-CoA synthetase
MSANLFQALLGGKEQEAKTAFRLPDGRAISYAALVARTAQLAHRLVALGVRPGDRVAMQVEKSVEALMVYLATLRVGAVHLPLNTGYTASELAYFLGDAEPRLVLFDPAVDAEVITMASAGGATVRTLGADGNAGTLLEELDRHPTAFSDVPVEPGDLAAILYTSGTTGRSKGAMLSHENLRSNAATLVESWRFTAADELLHALPIYHTHGLFVATNVALMSSATINLLPRFDIDAVLASLSTATVMMGVPTFYTRLLADPRLDRTSTASVRLFVSGSAPLLADTHRAWQAATGHAVLERYGMTETNMITSNPYDGERRAGTVGPPLPGVSVRIMREADGARAQAGEIGMIQVAGPNVFGGYWRRPELNASEFTADGYFITGDLGQVSEDGYVEIVGRGKDLIISGGLNVYPKEVESAIDALDGVEESAVIGLAHADLGEAVAAVVVASPGADRDPERILAELRKHLARFKVPKSILFVDALPRNAMGKVQKSVLRDSYADLHAARP